MRCTQQPMAWFLSFLLALVPLMPAQAAMLGNDRIISEQQAVLERTEILEILDQEFSRQQLEAWGVSPEMARARINSLTGQELANLNRQFNELEAGGDVLGILLIIFIVFVITDAIGATDIFPFVHPVK